MNAEETRAIMTVALMAAFADGLKDERERVAVREVANALGSAAGMDLAALYREVLIGKPDLPQVVRSIQTPEARQLAYEMAVGVCDADGAQGAEESAFLGRLAAALQLPEAAARQAASAADEIANAAVEPAPVAVPVTGVVLGKASVPQAELDRTILNASITNAALELLPETIASMGIIPLQLRLVYRIGKAYGYEMDASHAKDFLATLGVGLTGQYLEQAGRKLLGGLLGAVAGGLGRALGRQAASSGMTFATTYAIGRVAERYYAGGRTLDAETLKSTFASMLAEAKGLAPKYSSQIEQQARTIDTRSIAALIRQV